MIIPIATVLLTMVFLLLTIFRSRRSEIPTLKSSLLATLLSLDAETKRELVVVGSLTSMKEQARGYNVRLKRDGNEWQIVKGD